MSKEESLNKEEMLKRFNENVEYMQRNIPPDDIYMFSEQTFMAALFFMKKWAEYVNVTEEMCRDVIVDKWVRNILGFLEAREKNEDLTLDLSLESIEE